MGCGCKNKNNGGTNVSTQQPSNVTIINTQQEQNNTSVKSAVTKIVEKYYNKK